jgi:hypothetical protein
VNKRHLFLLLAIGALLASAAFVASGPVWP